MCDHTFASLAASVRRLGKFGVSATGITCPGRPTPSLFGPSSRVPLSRGGRLLHAGPREPGGTIFVSTQGVGIADPFADDLSTGRGIVLGRAATKLRSIEIQPLTGGSTDRRSADPRTSSFGSKLQNNPPVSSVCLRILLPSHHHCPQQRLLPLLPRLPLDCR